MPPVIPKGPCIRHVSALLQARRGHDPSHEYATAEIRVRSPPCLENAVVVGWFVPTFCFQSPATTYQSDRLASENRCLLRNVMARMGGNTLGIYAILEQGVRRILLPVIPKGPCIRHVSALRQARRGHEPSHDYSDDRDLRIIATMP